jgi:hypothetical protein
MYYNLAEDSIGPPWWPIEFCENVEITS